MKKLLIILGIVIYTTVVCQAAEQRQFDAPKLPMTAEEKAQKEAAFDKRLGLTEEQKIQAKAIRQSGFEQIKPVVDKIRAKKQDKDMLKRSNSGFRDEKVIKLDNEIKNLEKRAHNIRKENMKEFESILTSEQRNTLREMKQEGRKKYYENHPPCQRMPFGMPPDRRF